MCKEREKVKTEKTVSVAGIREAQSQERARTPLIPRTVEKPFHLHCCPEVRSNKNIGNLLS